MLHTEKSGTASPVFGEKFPYPLDGKQLMLEIVSQFAIEFNQAAKLELMERYGQARVDEWTDLMVTSAYPTARQHCPRIAIIRSGASPRSVGLGGEIESRKVTRSDGEMGFYVYKGQTITDTIQVDICTLNERLRDDLYTWLQQYLLDAIVWTLPQLSNVHSVSCTNAVDDQVEYEGSAAQPGFQFYVGRMTYQVMYDLMVIEGVDQLRAIVNWQEVVDAPA